MRWFYRTAFAALLIWGQSAHALQFMECDRLYVYFPEGEAQLAERMVAQCEPMRAFLEAQNVAVSKPLHIVLDDELDEPKVRVSLFPHKEIRIPLKVPGVLEDGYTEPDPWRYHLFMGLSALALYSERSGIPGMAHKIFGEIASPNLILPDWGVDGISYLLYEKFVQRPVADPAARSIFDSGAIPRLDEVSNHPEIWPGRFTYRIYGRPFVRWLYDRYGWEKLHAVLRLHGADIIPVEIDAEARRIFGMSWNQLWQVYRSEHSPILHDGLGLPMNGYWADPFVYWNESGVHPGRLSNERRGRYGYMDDDGWLWLSRYDKSGVAQITKEQRDGIRFMKRQHVWDPGPGSVAVTRQGSRPYLLISKQFLAVTPGSEPPEEDQADRLIAAPPGVMQLSGPVMDSDGRIAVAANMEGNWDIWLYDGTWYQITRSPGVELDPWLEDGTLVFASDASGRFQIHTLGMRQLTRAPTAAMFPRSSTHLQLGIGGWQPLDLVATDLPAIPDDLPAQTLTKAPPAEISREVRPYSAWSSIKPNYLVPDLFLDVNDLQFGIATTGRDVTGDYAWDAGIRYTVKDAVFTWRLGGQVKNFNTRATRYPFGYTTPGQASVNEVRHEVKLGWTPERFKDLNLSVNWRHWVPDNDDQLADDEWWGAIAYTHGYRNLRTQLNADLFNNDSQSIYGDLLFWFGQRIETLLHLQAGKTWGELLSGHNTFRVGGNSGEGFFTQRPSQLFPLRGFNSNIQDAGQAVTGSVEIYWPLARLQTGYKTLPLFLRNIGIGTFIDTGMAAEDFNGDELLVGAGFELITGLELAWGVLADFKLGVAWPLLQPDNLEPSGPIFLIQFGQPL